MSQPADVQDYMTLGLLRLKCEDALQVANASGVDLTKRSRDYDKVRQRIAVVGFFVERMPEAVKARHAKVDWSNIEARHQNWTARNFDIDSEELGQLRSNEIPALVSTLRAASASVRYP